MNLSIKNISKTFKLGLLALVLLFVTLVSSAFIQEAYAQGTWTAGSFTIYGMGCYTSDPSPGSAASGNCAPGATRTYYQWGGVLGDAACVANPAWPTGAPYNPYRWFNAYVQTCVGVTPPAINCSGSWSGWSACSGAGCGAGNGTQSRTYTVSVPASGGGSACPFSNGQTQNRSCDLAACAVPVNCAGYWSGGSCSASCGWGSRTETFVVTQAPANGGTACPSSPRTTSCWAGSCPVGPTPVNCAGYWTDTSSCSASCGGGTKQQGFVVTTAPANGGSACPSSPRSVSCNTNSCPGVDVDCQGYFTTGSCSNSCGAGTRTSTWVTTVPQQGNGAACPSSYTSPCTGNSGCTPDPDPVVNCSGSWSGYGGCSASCGPGTRTQTYSISTPASGGGAACSFSDGETQSISCNAGPCGSISANDCNIAVGDSSCDTSVSWSSSFTTPPISVTQNGVQFSTSGTGNAVRTITGESAITFRLSDSSSWSVSDTINVACAPGTLWSGGMCKTDIGPAPVIGSGIDIRINPDQTLFRSGAEIDVSGVVTTDDNLSCELTVLSQSQSSNTSPPLSTNTVGPISVQLSNQSIFTFTCNIISGTEVFSDGSTSVTIDKTVEVIPRIEEI